MYSQSVRRKALDALMLTGDFEKSARMSGVSSRTLRRWASSAAKPQQRSCGAKFKPYDDEIRSKAIEMARSGASCREVAAMRGEGPYPIKAFFSIGNNTLMSYAGQQGIIDALMNQDLVVSFEHWMTPTAQLSDYVLPGYMWAERSCLTKVFDVAPVFCPTEAFFEPVGECKSLFYLVQELATHLGHGNQFPWESEEAYNDWRLEHKLPIDSAQKALRQHKEAPCYPSQ